jgi:hypothetical protein
MRVGAVAYKKLFASLCDTPLGFNEGLYARPSKRSQITGMNA